MTGCLHRKESGSWILHTNMLSGKCWPAHPHPQPGECLSSWVVRCAHGNGLKIQTFNQVVFSHKNQLWNRDIDRLAPEWLTKTLAKKTGTSHQQVLRTTFRLFEKRLFPKLHLASQLRWVTPLKLHHRKHTGFGMQYCPCCLHEDQEAYFRLAWRCALYTFCPKHQVLLHDRCHACSAPVAYHRIELGKPQQLEVNTLDCCWQCEAKLSEAPIRPVHIKQKTAFKLWERVLRGIDKQFINAGPMNYQRLALVHQICRLITSESLAPNLHNYLCKKTQITMRSLNYSRRPFEQYSIDDRQHVLELAWWLVERPYLKLKTAKIKKIIKFNQLYRDQPDSSNFIKTLLQIDRSTGHNK